MMGTDGISFPLVVLTTFLSMLAMGASWPIKKHEKAYCVLFLLLETGMIGVFLALDFFLFYVFWEVMLLPMYFLIGIWGGPRKEYAAIKFFLYTLLGGVLMLIAILMLYFSSDLRELSPQQLVASGAISAGLDDAGHDRGRRSDPLGRDAAAHVQHPGPAADGSAHRAVQEPDPVGQVARMVGVRAAVHRLCDQGAERAVPHVVARCPRRGPDADLDDPGRRPA